MPGRRVEMTAKSPSTAPDRKAGSGRLKHSGVTPLTPIVGRSGTDPGENHDPGRQMAVTESLTPTPRLENSSKGELDPDTPTREHPD